MPSNKRRFYDRSSQNLSLSALKKPFDENFRKMIIKALEDGMHPYYVDQYFRLHTKIPVEGVLIPQGLYEVVHDICVQRRKFREIPEKWDESFRASLSRLYQHDNSPRHNVDLGIIHGAILETAYDLCEHIDEIGLTFSQWEQIRVGLLEGFLNHSDSDLTVLDLALYRMHQVQLEVCEKLGVDPTLHWDQEWCSSLFHEFMQNYTEKCGAVGVLEEILYLWSTNNKHGWRGCFFSVVFNAVVETPPEELVATAIFEVLVRALKNTDNRIRAGARELLNPRNVLDRGEDHIKGVMLAHAALIDKLKKEFPHPKAVQVTAQWFQTMPKGMRANALMSYSSCAGEYPGISEIDTRVEFFIEELFGKDVWRALCELHNPWLWNTSIPLTRSGNNYVNIGVDESHPAYAVFDKAVKSWDLERHDAGLAIAAETYVSTHGMSVHDAALQREQLLDVLSGDIIRSVPSAVSHLRSSWMPYKRKREEHLSKSFPVVEIARWKQDEEDRGPACRFRIVMDSKRSIRGALDTEGGMQLERVLVLTPTTRMNIQLVVLQTLGAVILPHFVATLPPMGVRGKGIAFTGEVWISRPILHTLGDLTRQRPKSGDEGGSRINPTIAEWVFKWLLNEMEDIEFDLFTVEGTRSKDRNNRFFTRVLDARKRLNERFLPLSQVYMRTVRAYSRPVAVHRDNVGTVIMEKMSERAQRKYARYREDGGRQLQFSPVPKTYKLRGGGEVSLDVPRTFNQGTFNTLNVVLGALLDPVLQERVRQRFVV